MIPFDEMPARLTALGKDRAWLAAESGRSPDSIRTALAPSATPSKRSELLQRALSDAIEREEARQAAGTDIPERISLEASREEVLSWSRAAKVASQNLYEWAVGALNRAADEHFEAKRRLPEVLPDLTVPKKSKSGA